MHCGYTLPANAAGSPGQPGDAPGLSGLPTYQDFLGKSAQDPQFQAIYQKYARSGVFNLKCDMLGIEFNLNSHNFVDRVWMYPPGTDGGPGYKGALPNGLTWSDRRADVDRKLGGPAKLINVFDDEYSVDYTRLRVLVKFNATSTQDTKAMINYVLVYT
jgi:hypothetical protein